MNKLTYEQSKHLMQLMTVLLKLEVIDLPQFANLSIDIASITNLDREDYVQLMMKLFTTLK